MSGTRSAATTEAVGPPALAETPTAPYYAVIFSSLRTQVDEGYEEAAARMLDLAHQQPGFLGVEAAREGGLGITVSYWASEEAIAGWRRHAEHVVIQELGREQWYERYALRVARVERETRFGGPPPAELPPTG